MKKLTTIATLTLTLIVVIAGVMLYHYFSPIEVERQFGQPIISGAVDVIGTRTGTSTSGTVFASTAATTTYPFYIGEEKSQAIFTVKTLAYTGTSDYARFAVLGSNDYNCETATTSPDVGNPVLMKDINWFDLGDNLRNKVHSTSLSAGTTTIPWSIKEKGSGREIVLTDLNTRCIALQVQASTTLWAQIQTK